MQNLHDLYFLMYTLFNDYKLMTIWFHKFDFDNNAGRFDKYITLYYISRERKTKSNQCSKTFSTTVCWWISIKDIFEVVDT